MKIKKEFREERDDVFGFYNTVKKLNETQTEIIEADELIKETCLDMLNRELSDINEMYYKVLESKTRIETMIQMINEYQEPEI